MVTRRAEEGTREAPSLSALGLCQCCPSNSLLPWKWSLIPGSASWCQAYPQLHPFRGASTHPCPLIRVCVPIIWSQGSSSLVLDLARQILVSYGPRLTCSYFLLPFPAFYTLGLCWEGWPGVPGQLPTLCLSSLTSV